MNNIEFSFIHSKVNNEKHDIQKEKPPKLSDLIWRNTTLFL